MSDAWWIDFWAHVPDTPLSAPYRWGPYPTEAEAEVDSRFVQAEKVAVVQGPASEEDWRFAAYPPQSSRCHAVSPEGERCKYQRGHDVTGEPHSWTPFGFGGPGRG